MFIGNGYFYKINYANRILSIIYRFIGFLGRGICSNNTVAAVGQTALKPTNPEQTIHQFPLMFFQEPLRLSLATHVSDSSSIDIYVHTCAAGVCNV